jgi:hypothetical protein
MNNTEQLPVGAAGWWEQRLRADRAEWFRVSAEMGEWLRGETGSEDLLAEVEPGAGLGHPAVHRPENRTVEVNPDRCAPGVDPADIDMGSEEGRLRHPALAGAGCHEGSHEQFTLWKLDQSPEKRAVVQAALLLEESAAERDRVRTVPGSRVLLRASFEHIVIGGLESVGGVGHAAQLAALIHGRVDAGILGEDEMAPAIEVLRGIVGDRYDQLREVWLGVHALPVRDDAAVMEAFGRQWLDILGDDAAGEDPGEDGVILCGSPSGGDSDGDPDGGREAAERIGRAARVVAEKAAEEAAEERSSVRAKAAARSAKQAAKQAAEQRKAAGEVFREVRFVGHGWGRGDEGLSGEREPLPVELQQANELARRLARAQFRERVATRTASALPPGRLIPQAAVRRSAERSMGLMSTAEPWRQTVRRHAEEPPITVAIGCDISGSMADVVGHVASAAWMIARAVHRNDGTTATVAYGERVHAVIRPGEAPRKVRMFNADGGWENWTAALDVMNGSVFADARGVRLAVFVSDGKYRSAQWSAGSARLAPMLRSGVKVLWIGLNGRSYDRVPEGCTYVHLSDPGKLGSIVGKTMVELLEKA